MVWNNSGMLYDTTNGRWKLPVGSGRIKRLHGSIIFTLNLVKLALQIGNQPGSSFVTMSQINKFHSHKFSYKNSYHKEILNLLKLPSHNPNKCKQNRSEINKWYSMTLLYDVSMMSWVIWCWHRSSDVDMRSSDLVMSHLMLIWKWFEYAFPQKTSIWFSTANRNQGSHTGHSWPLMWPFIIQ